MATDSRFKVVINHEEQYSILPVASVAPKGWKATGKVGTETECIQYIEEVWTDMRPPGLRQKLQAAARSERLESLRKP